MIKIEIITDGNKIMDNFLREVSSVLFRLKQIEHELIALDFNDEINISRGYPE